jgi:tetratricopeptide (TPR) repeat protein
MDVKINPKLLDVVQFDDPEIKDRTLRGTIVDTFGDLPDAFLVEVSDEKGVPVAYFTRSPEELKTIWQSSGAAQLPETIPEAQRFFENGVLFLQNGLLDRAKEQFSRAFALEPRLAGQLLNATGPLVENKAFDAAIIVCEMLLDLLPAYGYARENLSIAYLNRGVEFARHGVFGKAIEDFDRALMFRPSEPTVEAVRKNIAAIYGNLGLVYSEMRQHKQAMRFFQWSLELYPSEVARKNVALVQIAVSTETRMGNVGEEVFHQAIMLGLTRSECLNAYGATLGGIGKLPEARRALESAVEADPENEIAKRNLQTLSSREGNFAVGVSGFDITQPPHPIPGHFR